MNTLKQALQRIVIHKDFSRDAATALESVIAKSFPEEERFDKLQHILASYRLGGGEYLFDEKQLEHECDRVLKLL